MWLVDADDEWPETAIEVMLAAGEHGRADVVVAQARTVEATGSTPVGSLRGPLALSGRGAFTALLVGELTGHLWNKLFRRELFAGIDFTRIRQHSDQAQVAQLLAAADEVVVIPDSVYEYHLRSGSIIRSGAKRADSLAALAEVIERTARGLDPRVLGSRDYAYYRARFSLLSRFKDATSGAHTPADSRRLWRAAHDEARLRHLLALAGRRDVVRSVLFGLAVAAPPSTASRCGRGTDAGDRGSDGIREERGILLPGRVVFVIERNVRRGRYAFSLTPWSHSAVAPVHFSESCSPRAGFTSGASRRKGRT